MSKNKYDWKIHGVVPDGTRQHFWGMMDFHTHGLDKYLGAELQFVLGPPFYDIQEPGMILNDVGDLLKNGAYVVHDGLVIDDFFSDHAPIRINISKDSFGEDIWRIIVPDMELRWPEETDLEPFCLQMIDHSPYVSRGWENADE